MLEREGKEDVHPWEGASLPPWKAAELGLCPVGETGLISQGKKGGSSSDLERSPWMLGSNERQVEGGDGRWGGQ